MPYLIPLSMLPFDCFRIGGFWWPKIVSLSLVLIFFYLAWAIRGGKMEISLPLLLLTLFTCWTMWRFSGVASPIMTTFLWPFLLLIVITQCDYTKPILWTTTIIGLYAGLQMAGIDFTTGSKSLYHFGYIPSKVPFSVFGNPNFLGEWLVGVLPLALSASFWGGLGVAILIIATGSRAALLGMAVAAGFMAIYQHRGRFLALVLAAAVSILLIPGSFSKITQSQTGKARLLWWGVTTSMIEEQPIRGIGAAKLREMYPLYQKHFLQKHPGWKPLVKSAWAQGDNCIVEATHNDFLQIGAELGIPALCLFLFAIILFGLHCPIPQKSGILGLCVLGFFAYPFQNIGSLTLLGLLLASSRPKFLLKVSKHYLAPICVILAMFCAWKALPLMSAGKFLHTGMNLNRNEQPQKALVFLDRAEYLSPGDSEISFQRGVSMTKLHRFPEAYQYFLASLGGDNTPLTYEILYKLSGNPQFLAERQAIYPGL